MNKKKETIKKYQNTESEPRYEKLDSSMLHADLKYQNVFNPKIVKKIILEFDKKLLQPLEVSYRDGQYNVVDGKHRLTAIKEIESKTGIKIPVPCWVHYGLTEEEECNLFVELVKKRRKISSMELYKAAYESGDEFTVNFVETIRKVGFIFDFEGTSKNGRIHMTSTPSSIFEDLGQKRFEKYLTLLYKTWNGNKDFLGRDFMNGLHAFFNAYENDIEEKLFVKRLSIMKKDDISSFVYKQNRKDTWKVMALAIFQKYNRNKKLYPTNRLEEKSYFYMD